MSTEVPKDCVLKARRIIDGRTFNTETSTLVAYCTWEEDGYGIGDGVANLFMSRSGQFFEVERVTTKWRDRASNEWREKTRTDITPLDDETARAWSEKNEAKIVEDVFSALDEEGTATEERVILRMSSVLKSKLSARAKEAGKSINEFAIHCLEQCVTKREIVEHQSADGHTRTLEIREVEDDPELTAEERKMIEARKEKEQLLRGFELRKSYRPRAFK